MSELLCALFSLYPATTYYPYLLKCLEMLSGLIKDTKNYIPLFCKFKLLLTNKYFYKSSKVKKAKEFDFEVNIKCLKENYENNRYWTDYLNKILGLISENLSCYTNSPVFEDYACKYLKMLTKIYKLRNLPDRKNNIKNTVI